MKLLFKKYILNLKITSLIVNPEYNVKLDWSNTLGSVWEIVMITYSAINMRFETGSYCEM